MKYAQIGLGIAFLFIVWHLWSRQCELTERLDGVYQDRYSKSGHGTGVDGISKHYAKPYNEGGL
jgi:hypothetical protein